LLGESDCGLGRREGKRARHFDRSEAEPRGQEPFEHASPRREDKFGANRRGRAFAGIRMSLPRSAVKARCALMCDERTQAEHARGAPPLKSAARRRIMPSAARNTEKHVERQPGEIGSHQPKPVLRVRATMRQARTPGVERRMQIALGEPHEV